MTEEKIINALKLHASEKSKCLDCPYYHEQACSYDMAIDALDLINRQKAEIEKLTYQVNRLKKYDEERDIRLHERLTATARAEAIKELMFNLDNEISTYSSAGHDLNVYAWLKNYVKEMVGDTE